MDETLKKVCLRNTIHIRTKTCLSDGELTSLIHNMDLSAPCNQIMKYGRDLLFQIAPRFFRDFAVNLLEKQMNGVSPSYDVKFIDRRYTFIKLTNVACEFSDGILKKLFSPYGESIEIIRNYIRIRNENISLLPYPTFTDGQVLLVVLNRNCEINEMYRVQSVLSEINDTNLDINITIFSVDEFKREIQVSPIVRKRKEYRLARKGISGWSIIHSDLRSSDFFKQ